MIQPAFVSLFQRSVTVVAYASALMVTDAYAQAAGTFDTSFGVGGKVTNLTIAPPSGTTFAYALAVQTDGKILLAGSCGNSVSTGNTPCIARLLPDGQVDPNFTGPAGSAPGKFFLPFAESNFGRIEAIALTADGRIVVAARCSNDVQNKLCTMRLTTTGAFDATYNGGTGPGGELQFAMPTGDAFVTAVKVQPDGKTVFLFRCNTNKFCLQRINVNGSLDVSFDGPNASGTGVGSGNGRFALDLFGLGQELPADLAIASDGRLLATGSCLGPNGVGMCVVRLNPNGSYDTSFDGPSGGGNGRAVFGVNGVDQAVGNSIALQADGKIVVGGFCGNFSDSYRMCGVRLTVSGAFDPEFIGPTGNNPGRFRFPVLGVGGELVRRVAVQDDGRILLAGFCENGVPNTSGNDFCFARLNGDGSFDQSFDGANGNANGRFNVGISQDSDLLYGLALRPNGRIVAGGTCSDTGGGTSGGNAFCAAQFNGGSQGYETCSLDIDGDGVVGVNDAVVHARIGLGFRGPALFDGLTFSATGLRPTPTAIRSYLISQCGRVSP